MALTVCYMYFEYHHDCFNFEKTISKNIQFLNINNLHMAPTSEWEILHAEYICTIEEFTK